MLPDIIAKGDAPIIEADVTGNIADYYDQMRHTKR
jgi:hypothetical protein